MKDRYIHSAWLIGLLIIWSSLIISCSEQSEPDEQQGSLLQIYSLTRSTDELPVPIGTQIQLWLIQQDASSTPKGGLVTYAGKDAQNTDIWNSGVYVQGNKTYYIYGYTPSSLVESSNITATLTGTTVTGATLKLNGMSVLSEEDFSIVVGVKAGEDGNIQIGEFSYEASPDGNNGISLLVDHLYAGASFKMIINPDYNKLRTIKLKKMELVCTNQSMRSKVDATIAFVNGLANPVQSITTTAVSDADQAKQTLFEDADGVELKEDEHDESIVNVSKNFLPTFATSLSLVSTYDVYDKKENKIRENCQATNKLDVILSGIQRGQIRPVLLTVNPTYLYMLSEPDLDNPMVNIN